MDRQEYRKLDIDLPRQPLSEQRWWLLAGMLLAFVILLITAYAYMVHKKLPVPLQQQRENRYMVK